VINSDTSTELTTVYYPQCDKLFGAPSWFFTTKPPRANALTMSFYPELDQASFKQLTELWGGDIPGWADSRDSLLDEIAYSLAESGEAGVAFLKGYGRADDLAQRRAAVYFLVEPPSISLPLNILSMSIYCRIWMRHFMTMTWG
jgi:hypothetical protein